MTLPYSPLAALALLLLAATVSAQTPPGATAKPAWTAYQSPLTPSVPPGPAPEHVQALAELVGAFGVQNALRAVVQSQPAGSAVLADFQARFLTQFSDAEAQRRAALAYAPLFSQSEALELARAMRTHAAQAAGGTRARAPEAAARQLSHALQHTTAGKKWLANASAMDKANAALVRQWQMEYAVRLLKPSLAATIAVRQARIARGNTDEPTRFLPPPTGVAWVDRYSALMADVAFNTDHATWQLDQDLGALGITTLLTPQSLTDAANAGKRRAVLDAIETKVEQFLVEVNANLARHASELEALDMPFKDDFMLGARRGREGQLATCARVAENQRAVLDVMRRMLAFAESRQGKMSEREGKLVFKEEADRAAYLALVADARREGARNEQLRAAAAAGLDKAAEKVKP